MTGLTAPGTLEREYAEATEEELAERVREAKAALGKGLVILGHHYQRDEVIRFADFRGDSLKLSQQGAAARDASFIVFCGVHFMAESADILRAPHQRVILPDLKAGCSMADMADSDHAEECWDELEEAFPGEVTPITYINSTAAVKALVGREGGTVCTSGNAEASLRWAFARRPRVLFIPDEHLGRNTAFRMGIPLDEMVVWDPWRPHGGVAPESLRRARVILWKGCCSVHTRFAPEHVDRVREQVPGVQVLVHPECRFEVVQKADQVGSTETIIRTVGASPAGSRWAIGTEHHLVGRLAQENPDKTVLSLSGIACQCATMYRIDLPHLCWALENLREGRAVNCVSVPEETRAAARLALDRMLSIR
ncbi:MAG: quinolinate synthase NadA [Planctomycetales bacterium]|nr:quinolinate synthase NadA [Planctomycetales bacterium]